MEVVSNDKSEKWVMTEKYKVLRVVGAKGVTGMVGIELTTCLNRLGDAAHFLFSASCTLLDAVLYQVCPFITRFDLELPINVCMSSNKSHEGRDRVPMDTCRG